MRVVLLLTLFMAALPAQAQVIRTSACQPLVEHRPDASATYQPGVDVRGNDVPPADLGGGYNIGLPEQIDIPIRFDLGGRLGLAEEDFRGGLFEGEGVIGTLSLKGNDLFWNGERLRPQTAILITEECKEALAALGVHVPERKPDLAQETPQETPE